MPRKTQKGTNRSRLALRILKENFSPACAPNTRPPACGAACLVAGLEQFLLEAGSLKYFLWSGKNLVTVIDFELCRPKIRFIAFADC